MSARWRECGCGGGGGGGGGELRAERGREGIAGPVWLGRGGGGMESDDSADGRGVGG